PRVLELLERKEIRRAVHVCRSSLKISNEEADLLEGSLDVAHLFNDSAPSVAVMKRFLARAAAKESRQILRALASTWSEFRARVEWLGAQFQEFEKGDFAPTPLITGDDLTAAGMTPGPVF